MDTAREQTSRLLDLLRREQGAMADFLVALADFDRQRLWVGMGYTSVFYYLRRELKLSSGAAFLRKTAAELLQRFPEVEAPLRDGRLCISSVDVAVGGRRAAAGVEPGCSSGRNAVRAPGC